ncbi:hypothetical protein [Vibrio gallaecicus]|nr:hypothetical protein [Vibrio gallaecicus]MDN3613868.1 hypothetical protein [Vibrio gallaecicus]
MLLIDRNLCRQLKEGVNRGYLERRVRQLKALFDSFPEAESYQTELIN